MCLKIIKLEALRRDIIPYKSEYPQLFGSHWPIVPQILRPHCSLNELKKAFYKKSRNQTTSVSFISISIKAKSEYPLCWRLRFHIYEKWIDVFQFNITPSKKQIGLNSWKKNLFCSKSSFWPSKTIIKEKSHLFLILNNF